MMRPFDDLRPELTALLAELGFDPETGFDPRHLVGLALTLEPFPGGVWPTAPVTTASDAGWSAVQELRRVHELELAALLREASLMRFAREPLARSHTLLEGPPLALSDWRAAAEEELATLLRDEFLVVAGAVELLERCVAKRVADWPEPVELARKSLELEDCEAGRLRLAQGLLACGDHATAAVVCAAALARHPSPAFWPLFVEGLACAHELAGRLDRALMLYDFAGSKPAGSPARFATLATTFYLSLAMGDEPRARKTCERLELEALDAGFDAQELVRAEHQLRRQTSERRARGAWCVHERACVLGMALLARRASPAARILRTLC